MIVSGGLLGERERGEEAEGEEETHGKDESLELRDKRWKRRLAWESVDAWGILSMFCACLMFWSSEEAARAWPRASPPHVVAWR
jgi:hypothetical protein